MDPVKFLLHNSDYYVLRVRHSVHPFVILWFLNALFAISIPILRAFV